MNAVEFEVMVDNSQIDWAVPTLDDYTEAFRVIHAREREATAKAEKVEADKRVWKASADAYEAQLRKAQEPTHRALTDVELREGWLIYPDGGGAPLRQLNACNRSLEVRGNDIYETGERIGTLEVRSHQDTHVDLSNPYDGVRAAEQHVTEIEGQLFVNGQCIGRKL